MLVNIIQTFDEGGKRWFNGENPDVASDIAARWIGDFKATADRTPPQAGGLTAAQVAALQWGSGQKQPSFLFKPRPAAGTSSAATQANTTHEVILCPVPYYAVRIHARHFGGGGSIGAMTDYMSIVAATDSPGSHDFTDITTAAFKKSYSPWVAGVEYPDIRASVDAPGWVNVTWAAATSVTFADPGATKFTSKSSDIVYVTGILDSVSGKYPLLIRTHYGSTGYTYVSLPTGWQDGSNMITDWPERIAYGLIKNGNYVSTPTGWQNSSTGVNASGTAPHHIIEFFTEAGVFTVLTVGDSRFGTSTEFTTTKKYLSFEYYLFKALAARGVTPEVIRYGVSGAGFSLANDGTTTNYQEMALPVQALPSAPGWCIYLVYSTNDYATMTNDRARHAIARATHFASLARSQGQRVLFVPCYPESGALSSTELEALGLVRDFCNRVGDLVFDPIVEYGNPDGTQRLFALDSVHMTNAGYVDMAGKIAAMLVA